MRFPSRSARALPKRSVLLAVTIGLAGVWAQPAAAGNDTGPDYHSNCTAGFAVGSAIVDGSPGAVGTVARPPKQFGSLSDVGYYSRTNCG